MITNRIDLLIPCGNFYLVAFVRLLCLQYGISNHKKRNPTTDTDDCVDLNPVFEGRKIKKAWSHDPFSEDVLKSGMCVRM